MCFSLWPFDILQQVKSVVPNSSTHISKTESRPAIMWLSSHDHLLHNVTLIKNNGIEAS